jgi:hypothetical protein
MISTALIYGFRSPLLREAIFVYALIAGSRAGATCHRSFGVALDVSPTSARTILRTVPGLIERLGLPSQGTYLPPPASAAPGLWAALSVPWLRPLIIAPMRAARSAEDVATALQITGAELLAGLRRRDVREAIREATGARVWLHCHRP